MNISIEILDAFSVFDKTKIENLQEKELVPQMMIRRRLTRNAKILIYLANKISMTNERLIYASNYGELKESISILENILMQNSPSPTDFQNSVYNTPSAYLSILSNNTSEILTISNGDKTGENALKAAAIKSIDEDEICFCVCESFDIESIQQINKCGAMCESGVIFRIKNSNKKPDIFFKDIKQDARFTPSISKLISLYDIFAKNGSFILGVEC